MSQDYSHNTVLLDEAVKVLNIRSDGIYLDGTFGRGGHSRLILSKLNFNGKLFAIDRDPSALEEARKIQDTRFTMIHGLFSKMLNYMGDRNILGRVDGILLDLGMSSSQLNDPNRGFSFMNDGPIDMRMDPTCGQSASQWLVKASEDDIYWVLKTFGEERFAKTIAKAIVAKKQKKNT